MLLTTSIARFVRNEMSVARRAWFNAGAQHVRSTSWITDYSNMPISQRYEVLQDIVLPSMSANNSSDDDGPEIIPGHVATLHRELSRHKGSIHTSMQMRDDIMGLMRTKDISLSLPKLFSESPPSASSASSDEKAIRIKLKYLDKVVQSYLQTSLLCYDSMELRRIEFETSSGILLERVARGESVHRVRSIHELKRRLHDGKRCFGLFHSALKEDPLVFIHVGLTTDLSPTLSSLNATKSEIAPTHAMFYSVNSPHSGLRGLDIASLLIKEVVAYLQKAFPTIHTFSTLSPIPKFMSWLQDKANGKSSIVLPPQHVTHIIDAIQLYNQSNPNEQILSSTTSSNELLSQLMIILKDPRLTWIQQQSLSETLKPVMLWLGAYYISVEKANGKGKVLPLDDVARFHLRNGAVFHSINWMGNPNLSGIQTSATMMVNYLYDLDKVEFNAKEFGSSNWQPPTSQKVRAIFDI